MAGRTAGRALTMIDGPAGAMAPIVRLRDVALRYGKKTALDSVSLDIPSGRMVGLIGPDGVGKSSWLSLIAGDRALQARRVEVLAGAMATGAEDREAVVMGKGGSVTCD